MKSFQSFNELRIPRALAQSLRKIKFIEPTPIQAATILPALEGKDILGTAQTGTGKTGAFGIPLLANLYPDPSQLGLVLAPTRELAAQIFKVLRSMGQGMDLVGTLMVGGESFSRQANEFKRGVDYIVATPGRLNDHLEQRTVTLSRVTVLVLDEVDRMLDMGFAPQIKQILRFVPKKRQTMLFSATLPGEVMSLVHSLQKNPVRAEIGTSGEPVSDVKQEMLQTTAEGKIKLLLKILTEREGRILVFVKTQTNAEMVARLLEKKGFEGVVCMHGGRSNGQRKDALSKYHRGTHRIMVATDLAGRGIDVADIEHVINFDIPSSREDYVHRIGRTGRYGKSGNAVTFVTPLDFDSEYIITGKKKPKRLVFRSPRRR